MSYRINDESERDFVVTFLDDPPARAEAVTFFNSLERGLFPGMQLPEIIYDLSDDDAQDYLDEHPQQEQWSMLTICPNDRVDDDDLAHLQHLPELDTLQISSRNITDSGLRHLAWLTQLELLAIASPLVTDKCLAYFSGLTMLRRVDFQLAPHVGCDAYNRAMDRLPSIQDRYPPFPPLA